MSHWLTRFDPENGEPYGTDCDCDIDDDHYGDGSLTLPDDLPEELPAAAAAGEGDTPC